MCSAKLTIVNILLTGEPRSGKSTLLARFVDSLSAKQGFLANELRASDERTGFGLTSSDGTSAILASVDSDSPIRISRYGVDLETFEEFLKGLPPIQPGPILYIDEIGQMQLLSEQFKRIVTDYLDADNVFVGTITKVFQDDFTRTVLERDDIVLLEVDATTRAELQDILEALAANAIHLEKLSPAAKNTVMRIAQQYSKARKYTQFKKLFKNAVKYVAENRVEKSGSSHYIVRGNTNIHQVHEDNDIWQCDCDLYRGTGQFSGNAGECSHIQTVKIIS